MDAAHGHTREDHAEGKTPLDTEDAARTMLTEHIPLSLIMDLSSPVGPRSEELYSDEGADEMSWLEQPETS